MFHTNAGRFLWFDIRAVYAVTYIGTIGVGTNNVVYKFTFVCVWWSALIFIWKKFTNNKALFTLKKVNIEFNIKTVDTGEKTTLCSAEFHPYKFQILQIIRICHAKKGKGFSKPIKYFIHRITYQHKFCWYYPVPFQLDRNTCRPCWLVHTYDYIHDCRHTWIWLIWKNKIFDFDNSKLFNSYWEFSFTGIRNLKLNAM